MEIMSVLDKRVKVLVEDPTATNVRGFSPVEVRKISEMIIAIRVMDHPLQLRAVPEWRAHELKPGRPGVWALRVTPNYRLTFLVKQDDQEVHLLDYEDYH